MMTFAVNYVGHPFNTSIRENSGMFNSMRITVGFLAMVTMELVPDINKAIGMVPIPQVRLGRLGRLWGGGG